MCVLQIFMGALDGTKVRVVLASEAGPLSDKLKYAMENNIPCLKPDWMYESIKVGYALPFRKFIIKSVKACSTPEKPNSMYIMTDYYLLIQYKLPVLFTSI